MRQSLCLVAIVKNEAPIIKRCIDSVRPLITAWCIVDTGSTDGTQDIIKEQLNDIPGQLHERAWQDFAHNKTEAIQLAVGLAEYDLFLDADDVLEYPVNYTLPMLTEDEYHLVVEYNTHTQTRPHIFKNNAGYRYVDVRHEYLYKPPPTTQAFIKDILYKCCDGGIRSRTPNVYRQDARVIEEELQKQPNNPRYTFYAAQSWFAAGEYEKAVGYYKKRTKLGSYDQEIFLSYLRLGQCLVLLNQPYNVIFDAFTKAAECVPARRAEAFYELAKYFRIKQKYDLAYEYVRAVIGRTPPIGLNVNQSVYQWQLYDELAINAYYTKQYDQALDVFEQLLDHGGIFEGEVARLTTNAEKCRKTIETGETFEIL